MLKLKLQYFGTRCKEPSHQKKTEGLRRRGQQRLRWLDGITNSMDMNLRKFQEIAKDREAWHTAVHEVTKSQTLLGKGTTTVASFSLIGRVG